MDLLFTLFPADNVATGVRIPATWDGLCQVICGDPPAAREVPKKALALWSPATFKGDHRARANVEAVYALGFDVDVAPVPTENELRAALAGRACLFHLSSSSTPTAPRWRLLLHLSRPITSAEYDVLWAVTAKRLPFRVGTEAKDPSRGWYMPRVPAEGDFVGVVLPGAPLDVDVVLAAAPAPDESSAVRVAASSAPSNRRAAAAAQLGAVWPPMGSRHHAQLALAGALQREGFAEAEAVDFLCAVCRVAGDEDRPKREATVRDTYQRADRDETYTGWQVLGTYVDPVVVQSARDLLSGTAAIEHRIAQVQAANEPPPTPVGDVITVGRVTLKVGGFDAPLPPLDFQIDGLICKGDVTMLVAHGNSLKTWIAFSVALAVATGRPWLGRFAAQRGRVCIADLESGDYEVRRRLKLLGVKDADVADRLLRCSYPDWSLTKPETWLDLATLQLDLLVIDSFNAASPDVDENDPRAAGVLKLAGKFANATGCTVIVIHHARKGSGGDAREKVRGSTALYADCDRIFEFTEPEKKDGGIIQTSMRSIKDGAGRRPADVRVELSDQGLRFVDEAPKVEEKPEDANRAHVLRTLREHTAGVLKSDLLNTLKGKATTRRELLSALALAGVVVEYKADRGKVYVMLNPNAGQ